MQTASQAELTFSSGTLLLRSAGAGVVATFPADWWTRDDRIDAWRCDALRYVTAVKQLRRHSAVSNQVPQWDNIRWPRVTLPELRAEQREAVGQWMRTRRGYVVMPTGTGKTEVALKIMAETATSTLVVAPVRDLMYQWHRRILRGLGYDGGIIGDNQRNVRPVSVTTYDSACIHMDQLGNQFGLIVFDECHHLPGGMRRDAARMSAAPMRLGLTATPHRSDGLHVDLDWLIGPSAYQLELASVRGRSLADYQVVRIPVHLSQVERERYDSCSRVIRDYVTNRRQDEPSYSWEDLCKESGSDPDARRALQAYWTKQSLEDRAEEKLRVLEDLFRLHAGEPCLIFAGSNAMARDVSLRFLIPCLLNHCGKRERLDVLEGLAAGRYPALVANQVLDEGVDIPAVKIAVVIGGSASTRQAVQRLGRVLRKSGNTSAMLYEIVCAETTEERRSRKRRGSDAYKGTRHRRT